MTETLQRIRTGGDTETSTVDGEDLTEKEPRYKSRIRLIVEKELPGSRRERRSVVEGTVQSNITRNGRDVGTLINMIDKLSLMCEGGLPLRQRYIPYRLWIVYRVLGGKDTGTVCMIGKYPRLYRLPR